MVLAGWKLFFRRAFAHLLAGSTLIFIVPVEDARQALIVEGGPSRSKYLPLLLPVEAHPERAAARKKVSQ